MVKRILFISLIALSLLDSAKAQDPQFTQFYANPLYLNPAFAGTAICPRIIMNYRNQWPAISGTYVTYSASYDQHFDALHGGVGVLVTNDRAGEGTLNTLAASLMYSYRLEVSRKFSVKLGLQASYMQKKIDWSKLTFGDQIDPRYGFIYNTNEIGPNSPTRGFPDFSAGLLGFSERFYVGFAAHHLTQPDEGFLGVSKLPMKMTGHVGFVSYFNKKRKEKGNWSLNVLYQQQQDFQQINYGFYISKGVFVGGLWFRQNFFNADAFIALVGFQYQGFKFGYSYDVTVSKLSNATAGSHEFSVALQFPCKPKKKKFRAISCPSF